MSPWSSVVFVFLGGIVFTTSAHGASSEGVPWFLVGPQILNFSLFVAVLFFLLKKRARDIFAQREKDYTEHLQRAEREKDEAEKQKMVVIQKLKILEADAKVAAQKAQKEAEGLKHKIISEAQAISERSLLETERTVQYERNRIISELREKLLLEAFKGAEVLLKEKLDDSQQSELNKEFVEKALIQGSLLQKTQVAASS